MLGGAATSGGVANGRPGAELFDASHFLNGGGPVKLKFLHRPISHKAPLEAALFQASIHSICGKSETQRSLSCARKSFVSPHRSIADFECNIANVNGAHIRQD